MVHVKKFTSQTIRNK